MMIGICGATASGKTTFASRVLARVDGNSVSHLQHDSYYRGPDDLPQELRGKRNYDHPDSLDDALFLDHLRELRAGRCVEQPVYDFATHSRRPETRRVDPRPVLVVDGILIFANPAIRALLDLKVYIDTADDLRLLRRLQRDVRDRGRSLESVIEQYLDTVRPMHKQFVEQSRQHADVIIPGDAQGDVGVELLVARINAEIHDVRTRSGGAGPGPAGTRRPGFSSG